MSRMALLVVHWHLEDRRDFLGVDPEHALVVELELGLVSITLKAGGSWLVRAEMTDVLARLKTAIEVLNRC